MILTIAGFFLGMMSLEDLTAFDYNIQLLNRPSQLRQLPAECRYPTDAPNLTRQIAQRARQFNLSHKVMARAILLARDQQLFTGLVIVIISIIKHCSMTHYHFAVVNDLAWLSVTVCLGTDFIVRPALLENPLSQYGRFLIMMMLMITLLVTQPVTMKINYLHVLLASRCCCRLEKPVSHSAHHGCADMVSGPRGDLILPRHLDESETGPDHALLVEIIPAPCDIATLLYVSIGANWSQIMSAESHNQHGKFQILTWCKLAIQISFLLPAATSAVVSFMAFELLTSQFVWVLRNGILVVWSGLDLFRLRKAASKYGRQGDENEWTFGQLLVVMLAGVLVFQIGEI